MQNLARFGFTLLAGGVLLKLLALSFPSGSISPVGAHYKASLGALFADALRNLIAVGGRGLAIALPLAFLVGLLAGLRPGSRTDRILTAPAALLAGMPALPLTLTAVCALAVDLRWLGMNGSVHVALGLVTFPWLALAIRNGLAPLTQDEEGMHPVRAVTALAGALLSQTGNIALGSLAVSIYLVPEDGMLRLLELAGRMHDPVMLYTLLAPTMLLVAGAHLAGDLFLTFACGPAQPPRPRSRFRTGLGALLAVTGLLAFAFDAPAAANTLLVALGALLVAASVGLLLARMGPLVPGQSLPSLLPPLIIALALPVLTGRSLTMQMAAIGLGCAVTLAAPLRRLALADGPEERRPAMAAVAGAALLALAQAFGAQVTLGIMNAGLPLDLPSLGDVVRTSLLSDPDVQHYLPVLPVLALPAGLFLLGQAVSEQAGDEVLPAEPVPVSDEDPPVAEDVV